MCHKVHVCVSHTLTDVTQWWREPSNPLGPSLKRSHLESFRQQQLAGRPVVVVGTSIGGTIAADYALAYPEVWLCVCVYVCVCCNIRVLEKCCRVSLHLRCHQDCLP